MPAPLCELAARAKAGGPAFESRQGRKPRELGTPYGQNIATAEEPVLHRAIELAGAQSWGDG